MTSNHFIACVLHYLYEEAYVWDWIPMSLSLIVYFHFGVHRILFLLVIHFNYKSLKDSKNYVKEGLMFLSLNLGFKTNRFKQPPSK